MLKYIHICKRLNVSEVRHLPVKFYFLKSRKKVFIMMLNLTQHILTKEQAQNRIIEPLNKRYVCSLLTFYDIPTESDLKNRASQLADYALHENADSVLIGGAMYLMPFLIFELNKRNIDAYYSFSKRISKDVIQKDGRVKKTIIFKHCGFIKATLPKE